MTPQTASSKNLQLVLLDRDGVINVDSPDYIKSAEQWLPLPGAIAAIVKLQGAYAVAVCSNQSGVARGLFDESTLASIHDKLNACIKQAGGEAVDVFYCPHHPDAGCQCRKPAPELLHLAMRTHGAAAANTLYAGDSETDLLAAENAGCTPVLILTGNGRKAQRSQAGQRAELICTDLAALPAALAQTTTPKI